MPIETDWVAVTTDVPDAGLRLARNATETQRAAFATALDLIGCTALDCDLRLRAIRQGRYQLSGQVKAVVTQSCVVSLEPIQSNVAEMIDIEFWPSDQIAAPSKSAAAADDDSDFFDPNAGDDAEPIEQGRISFGRIVYECLAAGLDPYPRKPDAKLDWQGRRADAAKVHPFAALAKLKPQGNS
jgi:uncharacterized metal-binding protein YceD (DUF177 family)